MVFMVKRKLLEILSEKEDKNFEADQIISHVTKTKKQDWIFKKTLTKKQVKKCIKLAQKRKKNIPLQYILKTAEFYGISFKVSKGVLIPRPETELLVETALNLIKKDDKILDLGTGSGCISAAIAKNKKNVTIFSIEKFLKTIKYAKKNLKPYKSKVKIIKGDILNENFSKKFKNIDLIVSNPPYITKNEMQSLQKEVKFEPFAALYGGENGLKFYEKISSIWKDSLKKDGYLIFEIGHLQKKQVEDILKKNKFKEIKTYKDFSKKDRIVVAKK